METKYVRVPFDLELAKKIQSGEIEGRIFDTYYKCTVRIVDFNFQSYKGKLNVAISERGEGKERYSVFNDEGVLFLDIENKFDDEPVFMLEIPEYMTFKDGDVIAYDSFDTISITMADLIRNVNDVFAHYYAELRNEKLHFYEEGVRDVLNVGARLATEAEKQKLIDALKASKEPKAKECLKKLGIEVNQEYEFKPKDWVLCRASENDEWSLCILSHKSEKYNGYVVTGGIVYKDCIPYNESTAHLLGTTENYE